MSLFGYQVAGFGSGAAGPKNLLQILEGLGHTPDACWDVAAIDCYDGSAQDVFDLTANNVDLWRGTSDAATTDDPTFVGTAGDLLSSTYFTLDGGDFFRCKSQPAFIQKWHKATATVTCIILGYWDDLGIQGGCGTQARNIGNHGMFIDCHWTATGRNDMGVTISDSASLYDQGSTALWTENTIQLLGISIDEASAGTASKHYIDGTTEGYDGSYSAPAGTDASYTLEICAAGNAVAPYKAGSRFYACAFLPTTLDGAGFDAIRDELVTQGRIGA